MHSDDIDLLNQLNRDYVRSVQDSDARRFDEILAPDFVNRNPDGALIGRAAFLEQVARPPGIANLACSDVHIHRQELPEQRLPETPRQSPRPRCRRVFAPRSQAGAGVTGRGALFNRTTKIA